MYWYFIAKSPEEEVLDKLRKYNDYLQKSLNSGLLAPEKRKEIQETYDECSKLDQDYCANRGRSRVQVKLALRCIRSELEGVAKLSKAIAEGVKTKHVHVLENCVSKSNRIDILFFYTSILFCQIYEPASAADSSDEIPELDYQQLLSSIFSCPGNENLPPY